MSRVYSKCCWISVRYSPSVSNWHIRTTVNLSPRSDNGKINSSPVTRSPPIVRFPGGCRQSFRIPVEDPDGDTVKCRFATSTESLIPNSSFPYGTINEKHCLLTYNGSSEADGVFAVALTLEDFPAGTTDFDSVTPFSSIPLQFIVLVTGNYSGSCDKRPIFTASTPKDGECSDLAVGSEYRAVIEVQVADFSKSIVEIPTASPSGMQFTSLRNNELIYYKNVTWYPHQHQIGQQLFCFKAVDSSGQEQENVMTLSIPYSVVLNTLEEKGRTPRVILASRTPKNPISRYGPGYSHWSIQFDRSIKKAQRSSYIKLVSLPTGQTVYKVDALSQNVTIGSNSTTLHFAIPYPMLSMDGLYAILIEKGVVLGHGCSSGGTPTPGISSMSDWRFYVYGVCSSGYSLGSPYFYSCAVHSNATTQSQIQGFKLPADCDQVCNNTPGNYSCSCVTGYQLQSNGKSCKDMNECSAENGGCSHLCFNIPGSFYCACPEGFSMSGNNLTCVVGYGTFTFKMDFYHNSTFATPYTKQEYPIIVTLDEYVYLQFDVESSADLVIMAENCKATKDASSYSWPQYAFLENGCPKDLTLDYSYDPTQNYQQFKIRTLRFWNDYDTVYLHCELLACHRNSINSRCSKGCVKSMRKKREIKGDGIEHEESTKKVILTSGPVVIKKLKEESKNLRKGKQTALVGGLVGTGGFGLVAVGALAVLFIKYRRAQRNGGRIL
ncbi:Deleted in malignant brain tumors 1 protein [Stylophora pistillata]|uniref:Deleted in malignant brain tumors 1 protein n=1 Tax=Stylophora pistillata TaxID=50429 RepID=A0A2B4SH09_STYPI|nr:Deleted in malignant brain tumors 1 protein [Stylophora pistillata]